MVKSSSINPVFTTVIGLCVANSFTALSGCLLSQSQKSVDINIGQGMVTIALASLLIGGTILGQRWNFCKSSRNGTWFFYFPSGLYRCAAFNMPAFMLKLVSSVIVVSGNFRPISEETVAADLKKNDSQKETDDPC